MPAVDYEALAQDPYNLPDLPDIPNYTGAAGDEEKPNGRPSTK
jgi:hypothetical protein